MGVRFELQIRAQHNVSDPVPSYPHFVPAWAMQRVSKTRRRKRWLCGVLCHIRYIVISVANTALNDLLQYLDFFFSFFLSCTNYCSTFGVVPDPAALSRLRFTLPLAAWPKPAIAKLTAAVGVTLSWPVAYAVRV